MKLGRISFALLTVLFLVSVASSSPLFEATALIDQGLYREAIPLLDQAISENANDFDTWAMKAYAHLMLVEYMDALSAANAAIAINPNDSDIHTNKAAALIGLARAGQFSDVQAAYRNAIKEANIAKDLNIQNKRAWYNHGIAMWELGELIGDYGYLAEADYDFSYALLIDPNDTQAIEASNNVTQRLREVGYEPPQDNGFPGGKDETIVAY